MGLKSCVLWTAGCSTSQRVFRSCWTVHISSENQLYSFSWLDVVKRKIWFGTLKMRAFCKTAWCLYCKWEMHVMNCELVCLFGVCYHMPSHVCQSTYFNHIPKKQNLSWGLFCFEMWRRISGVRFRDVSKARGAFVLKPWRFQKAFFLQATIPQKTSV